MSNRGHTLWQKFFASGQLQNHHNGATLIASKDISFAVHVSPPFGDTNPLPITSLDCNVILFMKKLPVNCICFTISDLELHIPAVQALCADCVNDYMMAQRAVLHLCDKIGTRNWLNAKHLSYNKLIEFFGSKFLGWAHGQHLRKRTKPRGVYIIGVGHQFVDHLRSPLSLFSDQSGQFDTYYIDMAHWLKKCTVKKTNSL
jgi:hypothetical protein